MLATSKSILDLKAGDLMTHELVSLPQDLSMQEAARMLLQHRISGAPVVDEQGKCVGVISSTDFVALANLAEPVMCSFQERRRFPEEKEIAGCTLPMGACPYQRRQMTPEGEEITICSQPHCVCTDWEVVEVESLPTEAVRQFMTADPVMVKADVPISTLARQMIDAHIHRVIVVDERQKPIGIVSSTDLLAALAYSDPYERREL